MSTTGMESKQDVIRNGVHVTQLKETVAAVKQDPELAAFKFRAKNQWVDGGLNQIQIDDYYGTKQEIQRKKPFEFRADEPPVLLGKDQGANPVEYLLTALSGCMTTTLAYHTASRGMEIEAVQSEYEGDIDLNGFLCIDPEVRKGYQEIRVTFKVKGDVSEEDIKELVQNSPVYDTITKPTPVRIIVEKE